MQVALVTGASRGVGTLGRHYVRIRPGRALEPVETSACCAAKRKFQQLVA